MWVYKGVEVTIDMRSKVLFTDVFSELLHSEWCMPRTKEYINKKDITSITPIPNPPNLLPVGTKVRVFEEYDWWYHNGNVYDIVSYDDELYYYKVDNGDLLRWAYIKLPARAVVPVWEE